MLMIMLAIILIVILIDRVSSPLQAAHSHVSEANCGSVQPGN